MVDRIRWDTVSYLPFYYVFFQFLLLTIFNLQANILTTKDILSNLGCSQWLIVCIPWLSYTSRATSHDPFERKEEEEVVMTRNYNLLQKTTKVM